MKLKFLFAVFVIVFCIHAEILIIPDDFSNIQTAIIASENSDTLLVERGIYHENINLQGKNIKLVSNYYFTEDSTDIAETIIDGNQNGSVVTFNHREDTLCVLCGFTIMNGSGTPTWDENYTVGGGIFITKNSDPVLTDLIIRDNSCYQGGGINIYNSDPVLRNLKVNNNEVLSYCGGIYISNSRAILQNITVSDNSSYQTGGLTLKDANPQIENLIIENNIATYVCGGMLIYNYESMGNIDVSGIIVRNNSASQGGGIVIGGGAVTLKNSIVKNNSAEVKAGGIYVVSNLLVTLDNLLITGNTAPEASAVLMENFTDICNCTIADNIGNSAINADYNISCKIINSIISNGNANEINLGFWQGTRLYLAYTCLNGGEAVISGNGEYFLVIGNIFSEPCFAAIDNYNLSSYSPCIDAGTPSFQWYDFTTFQYEGEFCGTAPDMGCFEYSANSSNENVIPENSSINCYPNPFNPQTNICFKIYRPADISISIYNTKGQKVDTIVNEFKNPGKYNIIWNPVNQPTGIYLIRLSNGFSIQTSKAVLVK